MPYSSQSEFLQGVAANTLGAPATVFAAGTKNKIGSITLSGGTDVKTILIQNAGATITYFTIYLAIGASVVLPGIELPDGLRITCSVGTGGAASYTVLYFNG